MAKTHHLDRRADQIAAAGAGDPDDLLTTLQVAAWLGVSQQFLEIGRVKNYGPRFTKLGRTVRYKRSDVLAWLKKRTHACTSEYRDERAA